ncbi:MAG: UDP-N-acetylmuramate--L-alanine ligase [bacterium]
MKFNLKKVHVIGAGGIGLSAVAKLLIHEGVQVSGSDMVQTVVTDLLAKLGVTVAIGQRAENVPSDADLILFSGAVPPSNPERKRGAELGIKEQTYNQFLGEISRAYRTIAICGTHGKSTTTAMLGKILEHAGLDPLVIVGSLVPGFPDGNLRMGRGEWFVVEACEHMRHFLELTPEIVVVTNIEADHLDFYRDLNDIKSAFTEFTSRAKKVIWCADDLGAQDVMHGRGEAITLDDAKGAEVKAHDITHADGNQTFTLSDARENLEITLPLPGTHNIIDASLAARAAREVGASIDKIEESLLEYRGIWRRFERVGEFNGAPVYSDYAHHPTEIRATLQAARELYPNNRLIVAFKPHQRDRTKNLWAEFVRCFEGADMLILADIYEPSGREMQDEEVTSRRLIDEIRAHNEVAGIHQALSYQPKNDDVLDFLDQTVRPPVRGMPGDIIFIIGAGDIDDVARKIVK